MQKASGKGKRQSAKGKVQKASAKGKRQKANAKGKRKMQAQVQIHAELGTRNLELFKEKLDPQSRSYSHNQPCFPLLFAREGWPTKEVGMSWVREAGIEIEKKCLNMIYKMSKMNKIK